MSEQTSRSPERTGRMTTRRIPSTAKALLIGVMLGFMSFAALRTVFWEAFLPGRLECVVRSADGCIAWTDTKRMRRYLNAKAGQ